MAGRLSVCGTTWPARAPDFQPSGIDNDERLALELDADFYASLNLQAARDRDNRSALARAGTRIVAADRAYRAITVARQPHGSGYELRVSRATDDAPRCRPLGEIKTDESALAS